MFKKIQAILVAFLAMCWDVRHIFLPITVYRPDDWRWLSAKMQRSFARHFRRAYWDGILATRGIFPISGATVTAVTPLAMVMNTASVDTADADATDVTTAADGWDIAAAGHSGDRLLVKFVDSSETATVTISAGDRPPSMRSDATLAITLAASDVKYVCLEASKYLQNDGTIHAISSAENTRCGAFILPKSS